MLLSHCLLTGEEREKEGGGRREGGGGGKERWKEGEVKGRREEERLLCMIFI